MKKILAMILVAIAMIVSCEPIVDDYNEPTVENTEKGDFSASTEDMIPENGNM